MTLRELAAERPLYPRPLWLEHSYESEGPRVRCLRCRATSAPGDSPRARVDFELLHALCPAPRRAPAPAEGE